jgi:hypothetical protein
MLPHMPPFNYTLSSALMVGSDNEFISTVAEASYFAETATYYGEVTDHFFTSDRVCPGRVSCRSREWQRSLDGYHLG